MIDTSGATRLTTPSLRGASPDAPRRAGRTIGWPVAADLAETLNHCQAVSFDYPSDRISIARCNSTRSDFSSCGPSTDESLAPTSNAAAQEYVVVPHHLTLPLPDGVSFDVGATIGITALTAHRYLTVREGGPAMVAIAKIVYTHCGVHVGSQIARHVDLG